MYTPFVYIKDITFSSFLLYYATQTVKFVAKL